MIYCFLACPPARQADCSERLLDLLGDLVGGQAVLAQDVRGLAGLAELIVDADLANLQLTLPMSTSATASPRPPMTLCSSTVTTLPHFSAHWVTQAASMGLMVWTLMTAMRMLGLQQPGGRQRLADHQPQANTAASVPSRRTLALPISKG